MNQLTRFEIITALSKHLESLDYVYALWEAGSAAFGRVDAYSDIDLHVIVADAAVEQTFVQCQSVLTALSPITDQYRVPEPTWHGHSQIFYTLKNAPEFLLIDLAVMKAGSKEKFLQPEVHGEPVVLFDKTGAVTANPFDYEAHDAMLQDRIAHLGAMFARMQSYVRKEILRGNILDAMYFYPGTLRPLVELLRIKYDPTRYNWGQRYLGFYLPPADRKKLESLNLIKDIADLDQKQKVAQEWVKQLLDDLSEGG